MDTMAGYGAIVGPDEADRILSFGWGALERPLRAFERILERSADLTDREMIFHITRWPSRVMKAALDRGDHFLFKEAAQLHVWMYQLSAEAEPRAERILRDHSWRRLKEFVDFRLSTRLSESSVDDRRIGLIPRYAERIAVAFANLLRVAVERADDQYAEVAGREYWACLRMGVFGFDRRAQYSRARASSKASAKAEAQAEVARIFGKIGIAPGAWACALWEQRRIPYLTWLTVFRTMAAGFEDFGGLWEAFNGAMMASSADTYVMSNWFVGEIPDGQMTWVDSEAPIALFFAAAALRMPIPDAEALLRGNDAARAQAIWVQEKLDTALQTIRADPRRWDLSQEQVDERAPLLTRILELGVQFEERAQRELVMLQPLSEAKVGEFKAELLSAWRRFATVRRLLASVDVVHDPSPPGLPFGVFRYFPKGPFVEETGAVHWLGGIGEDLGRSLADGEDRAMVQALRSAVEAETLAADALGDGLSAALKRLSEEGRHARAILVSGNDSDLRAVETSRAFVPRYRTPDVAHESPTMMGTFGEVPIYLVGADGATEWLVLGTTFGRLTQFVSDEDEPLYEFSVRAYSGEEARALARSDRTLLPLDLREMNEDAVVDFLRENVLLRVTELFRLEVADAASVRRLVVAETPESRQPGN